MTPTAAALLVVDMQAEVFAGDLTAVYARATPRLAVANGSDAWYLADLLEHYGMPWGAWSDILAKWDANRVAATQLDLDLLVDEPQIVCVDDEPVSDRGRLRVHDRLEHRPWDARHRHRDGQYGRERFRRARAATCNKLRTTHDLLQH